MRHTQTQGFTLIELLVSISIFTLITTVAVYNHAEFNGSVLLTNLAYDVGLSIRQAQVYGITVKQTSLDSTKFNSGYGIHFDLSTPMTYTLFEDVTPSGGAPDHLYSASGGDVPVETYHISKGNTISKICVDSNCTNTVVDISFIRPNPDAYIRASVGCSGAYCGKAEICVSSPGGLKRKVVVESTGQISVGTDAASPVCN